MKRKRKKHSKIAKDKRPLKRSFSLAFLLAIPGNFILAGILIITFFSLFENSIIEKENWAIFATGLIGSLVVIGTTKMPTFRTFIHELKHALLVVFTGNKVKNFHVDTHTGHVEFQMCSTKVHFAPIIALAPYFLPIFSFPILAVCIFLEPLYGPILCLVLGLALAADISLGISEIHSHQTDLKKVMGGFLGSALYLSGVHLMWFAACIIWVQGGRAGYLFAGNVTWEFALRLAERVGVG